MTWRIGSLFAGVGGIDLGLHAAGVGETAWFSEYDKDASAVLAARFPDVANLGDVTAIDWSKVEPVDVLVGGYPCQPFSFAGQRGGADDARHLWPHFARALRVLRPRWAVLENVSGHLSLGFDAVLADLAEAGFDAVWTTLRASDVGAPHRRERLFVVAALTDDGGRHGWGASGAWATGRGDEAGFGWAAGAGSDVASDAGSAGTRWDGRGAPVAQEPAGWSEPGDADAPGLHRGVAADANSTRPQRRDALRRGGGECPAGTGGVDAAADAHARRLEVGAQLDGEAQRDPTDRHPRGQHADRRDDAPAWGAYAAAIARWEHALGRAAPAPVDERGRLNAGFSEWMMGFPEGWVTDVLPRNPALRCIGNAVVPAVAQVVGMWLLEMAEAEAVRA